MTRRRRMLYGAGALVLAGFLFLNLLAWRHARAMTRFSSQTTRTPSPEQLSFRDKCAVLWNGVEFPRPSYSITPDALADNAQVHRIPVSHDIMLNAWYAPSTNPAPLVILFHGYTADLSSLVHEGRQFLEMGHPVLLVDFRGSGGSSEAYTTLGMLETEDVLIAMSYAGRTLGHSNIILFGQSMGAAAILRAIADYRLKPDAVILEAVFDSLRQTIYNRFHAMGVPPFPAADLLVFYGGLMHRRNAFAHQPVRYAASATMPVLVLHGENDPRAKAAEGRRVYDALPPVTGRFHLFPDTGHESYSQKHPKEWRRGVERFLDDL